MKTVSHVVSKMNFYCNKCHQYCIEVKRLKAVVPSNNGGNIERSAQQFFHVHTFRSYLISTNGYSYLKPIYVPLVSGHSARKAVETQFGTCIRVLLLKILQRLYVKILYANFRTLAIVSFIFSSVFHVPTLARCFFSSVSESLPTLSRDFLFDSS